MAKNGLKMVEFFRGASYVINKNLFYFFLVGLTYDI